MLFASTKLLEPPKVQLENIDSSMTGKVISTSGEIKDYSFNNGYSFFKLESSNSTIKAVNFNSENSFSNGAQVKVEGEIAIYRGKMEIMVDSIEKK